MNTKTLSELEDKYIGKQGTPARIAYEKEVSDLMIGFSGEECQAQTRPYPGRTG